jgi:hypothetical protein
MTEAAPPRKLRARDAGLVILGFLVLLCFIAINSLRGEAGYPSLPGSVATGVLLVGIPVVLLLFFALAMEHGQGGEERAWGGQLPGARPAPGRRPGGRGRALVAALTVIVVLLLAVSSVSMGLVKIPPMGPSCPNQYYTEGSTSDCKALKTLDSGYFTAVSATLSIRSYTGENDSLSGPSHFGLQVNTNLYSDGEVWFQFVVPFFPDRGGFLRSLPTAQIWWFGPQNSIPQCPTGWYYYDGSQGGRSGSYCNLVTRSEVTFDVGEFAAGNESLEFTGAFGANGSITYSLDYLAGGAVTQRVSNQYQLSGALVPYGHVTSVEAMVVGAGDGSLATFNSGTEFGLVFQPTTNTGVGYGKGWTGGAQSVGTEERSNLVPSIDYAGNRQTVLLSVSQ